MTPDWIGWLATAIFLASYSCKHQKTLRRTQAVAALLWVGYGAILHAVPIVVANLLVAGVAVYSSLAGSFGRKNPTPALLMESGVRPASEPDRSRTSSPYN
jgi:fructose-specific phosphotransferase system IIC component